MFPGPGAQIYRNEAGEPIGWDYPSYDEDPNEYEDSMNGMYDEEDYDDD